MPRYTIQTTQTFHVTYELDADSPEDAWSDLLDGAGTNLDRTPGDISGTPATSYIEQDGEPLAPDSPPDDEDDVSDEDLGMMPKVSEPTIFHIATVATQTEFMVPLSITDPETVLFSMVHSYLAGLGFRVPLLGFGIQYQVRPQELLIGSLFTGVPFDDEN